MAEGGRETGKYGRFLGQPALVELASAQHAVLGLEQLRALGLSESAVHKRAANGELHRIQRGVDSLVPRELLSREGHWMAAVLACGSGAVLSHRSAAALHELRAYGGSKIDVTVPSRSARARNGIVVHRSTTLSAADTTTVNDIPCTTIARTQLDLAEILSRREVERALDQAEILEVFDLRALHDQLSRNATRRGAGLIRAVLAEHYIGRTPTWTELEEAFLALTRSAGLPDPEVNAWIDPADGGPPIRGDFVWRAERVIVETDGHKFHRTRQAFEHDRRRDQRLTVAGWRAIRTTWRQIVYAQIELRQTLVALVS